MSLYQLAWADVKRRGPTGRNFLPILVGISRGPLARVPSKKLGASSSNAHAGSLRSSPSNAWPRG